MKHSLRRFSVAGLLLLGVSVSSFAQNAEPINIVTTAVPFLRISPDARAGGMGDMGISTTPDINSQFYNVGLARFKFY